MTTISDLNTEIINVQYTYNNGVDEFMMLYDSATAEYDLETSIVAELLEDNNLTFGPIALHA